MGTGAASFAGVFVLFFCSLAFGESFFISGHPLPTNPVIDDQFLVLENGLRLEQIAVEGEPLMLRSGKGDLWGPTQQLSYNNLVNETLNPNKADLQWELMDLDSGHVLGQSCHPSLKFFGASVSKIFVAGALLDFKRGQLNRSERQHLANMLVVSDNNSWLYLQNEILGEGDSSLGRQRVQEFTQKMGYARTRGFQGWWGDVHGNELTAQETSEFFYDTYQGHYPGAEWLWKLLFTVRTGTNRAKRFLPTNLFVGGKTGTYTGSTVNPETGEETFPDGSPYKVSVRHHSVVFVLNEKVYSLVIFNNRGDEELTSLLANGLFLDLKSDQLPSCH